MKNEEELEIKDDVLQPEIKDDKELVIEYQTMIYNKIIGFDLY